MAISAKSFNELVKKDVFTSKGVYCGKITDVGLDMEKFRVKSVVIDAIRGSFLAQIVGDKRGVIVPFAMVQSIGDVVLIKHISPTAIESEEAAAAPKAEAMKK